MTGTSCELYAHLLKSPPRFSKMRTVVLLECLLRMIGSEDCMQQESRKQWLSFSMTDVKLLSANMSNTCRGSVCLNLVD